MFIIGTGKTRASGPPRYLNSGRFSAAAAACATARETPSSAFAPKLFLLGVPSSSISFLSIFAWSSTSHPLRAGAILSLTLATAFLTPLPPNRLLLPSRNSHASCSPVLAPLGIAARPSAPLSTRTSTSMVGLPRESKISRAWIRLMEVLAIFSARTRTAFRRRGNHALTCSGKFSVTHAIIATAERDQKGASTAQRDSYWQFRWDTHSLSDDSFSRIRGDCVGGRYLGYRRRRDRAHSGRPTGKSRQKRVDQYSNAR